MDRVGEASVVPILLLALETEFYSSSLIAGYCLNNYREG